MQLNLFHISRQFCLGLRLRKSPALVGPPEQSSPLLCQPVPFGPPLSPLASLLDQLALSLYLRRAGQFSK